jgi:hypothetical protein
MALEPVGDAAKVPGIVRMANKLNEKLGDKIKSASIILKPAEGPPGQSMPERSDGGPATGFWKAGRREIWLLDELDDYPVAKTLAHEAMHVLDTDYLTRAQKLEIVALMQPLPKTWSDQSVNGVFRKYVGLPSEVFAVYASAAMGGFPRPAYRRLFKRSIPRLHWKRLEEIALRANDPADRGKDPPEEVVMPPDPLDEVERQLAETQKQLQDALARVNTLQAKVNALGGG